ncbi:hypothetical protein HMPREF9727_01351 [Treponema denticola MYR-T]|uniref:Uncharacterized protein n=1 Tax=Treponema denticola H1-T TaxID=999431 RepID=M2BJX2_TREDN|nr:hypothetical protein [Treponema denticola]EMB29560.1 hypothetical protein HMPREF9727_01351 [Treponema denticola MYR-T]EMB29680.1 hypothetical protein HMPREF9725_01707 [Treponema denticola H1-T]EMB40528.1 hypothetical protein HMPREF9722_01498 [Treponema denticola ATCC 33520]EMB47032.1 hypothetical protein HMPREF9730_00050 [Treponema denticola AL-2]
MKGTHNQAFLIAQEKYFLTGQEIYLNEIYDLVCNLAQRYIINYGKNKKVFIKDVEEKAHDVASAIIERKFIRKVGKPIDKLTSYIYKDCLHEIVKDAGYERMTNGYTEILL